MSSWEETHPAKEMPIRPGRAYGLRTLRPCGCECGLAEVGAAPAGSRGTAPLGRSAELLQRKGSRGVRVIGL